MNFSLQFINVQQSSNMRFIGLLAFILFSISLTFSQTGKGFQLISAGDFDKAKGVFIAETVDEDLILKNKYGLALLFANSGYTGFNPDSAYYFLLRFQRQLKRASKKTQKSIEKTGIGPAEVRTLKNKIKEEALNYALQFGSSAYVASFLDNYNRIPEATYNKAVKAYHEKKFVELQKSSNYDSLVIFWETSRAKIESHSPDLVQPIYQLAYDKYFEEKDKTDLVHLLFFLKKFPSFSKDLDMALSQAFERKPFVELTEYIIQPLNKRDLPLTVNAIYQYYRYTGEAHHLKEFAQKYVDYSDSEFLKNDLEKLKKAENVTEEDVDDATLLYNKYIKVLAPNYKAFISMQKLIKRDLDRKNWDAALSKLDTFQGLFEDEKWLVDLRVVLETPTTGVKAEFLAEKTNSEYREYAPTMSLSGKGLYFCRKIDNQEDIYLSIRNKEGEWVEPREVTDLNFPYKNEAPLSITGDGSALILFDEGVVKLSKLSKSGWASPESFFS